MVLNKKLLQSVILFFILLINTTFVRGERFLSPEKLTKIKAKYGQKAYDRVEQWLKLLNSPQDVSDLEKLKRVNNFFNKVRFISDIKHWKQQDYWATPLEMLITDGGDCEDFSVAKYFSLRELGVSMDKLRLTYVKALKLNQAHMVLSYFPEKNAEPLILDNLIDEIKPASARTDLQPVYSFNGEDLWLSKERSEGKWIGIGKSSRISVWNDLLKKYSDEMIQTTQKPAKLKPQGEKNESL